MMRVVCGSALIVLLLTACSDRTGIAARPLVAAEPDYSMTVYKSPTCGCCSAWISYLEEEGFTIDAVDSNEMDSIKVRLGLPSGELASCHTATIDGYLIEGHVPASDIKRLLSEKPQDIRGLSAPGMPAMSPGMGSRDPQDYDVLSFTSTGETAVYSSY